MVASFRACPPIMHPHRDARLATPTSRAAAGLGKLARHVSVGRLRRTCRPRRQHPPGLRKRQGTRAARGRSGRPKGRPNKHLYVQKRIRAGPLEPVLSCNGRTLSWLLPCPRTPPWSPIGCWPGGGSEVRGRLRRARLWAVGLRFCTSKLFVEMQPRQNAQDNAGQEVFRVGRVGTSLVSAASYDVSAIKVRRLVCWSAHRAPDSRAFSSGRSRRRRSPAARF